LIVTTSNPELEPQRGAGAESGIYHEVAATGARIGATVTVYQLDMRDELNFLQSFRYVNIGRSRHRGFEAGLIVSEACVGLPSITLEDVKARAGDVPGTSSKAIPGQVYRQGSISPERVGTATISALGPTCSSTTPTRVVFHLDPRRHAGVALRQTFRSSSARAICSTSDRQDRFPRPGRIRRSVLLSGSWSRLHGRSDMAAERFGKLWKVADAPLLMFVFSVVIQVNDLLVCRGDVRRSCRRLRALRRDRCVVAPVITGLVALAGRPRSRLSHRQCPSSTCSKFG
jgi:hypothetical protein